MSDKYARTKWFRHDRFGMFIHWGLSAIHSQSCWYRSLQEVPKEEHDYLQQEFNPVDYDPKCWARLAKLAGMKYAVLIAKHHDGFCLFDTKTTDFNAMHSCGRDLVKEYVEAFRAEGLRVGLYYSLLDWHHPDYPHYGDRHHPMRNHPEYSNESRDFNRYLDYMFTQVEELCSNYGKLDLLWFDFGYDHLRGEGWRGSKLIEMVRSYQPDVVIDNRLEGSGDDFGSLITANPTACSGDFVSPEQFVPPEGFVDRAGARIPWEACVTMNNHWMYCRQDKYFKSPEMLIQKLVECVSKGGNMLLNVGPDARGRIPRRSVEILQAIGQWMDDNGESIYGCGPSELAKPEYGRITQRGNFLYYHVMQGQIGNIYLPGIRHEQIKKIRLLRDKTVVSVVREWVVTNYPDYVFVSLGDDPILPDTADTVIEVELKA